MAELDPSREIEPVGNQAPSPGQTSLVVATTASISGDPLQAMVDNLAHTRSLIPDCRQIVLALPGVPAAPPPIADAATGPDENAPVLVVSYAQPAADPGAIPWLASTASYRPIAEVAANHRARACTVLGNAVEPGAGPIPAEKLALLLNPVMQGSFDLVMPLYATEPFDDLVNKSLLYPLTRSLYGHRIQNPLGGEFQMSARMFPLLLSSPPGSSPRNQGRLPWLATIAANRGCKMCQARLGKRPSHSADGIELSDALAQLAGPLFLDMEDNAAFWQRIRGSHDVPTFGSPTVEVAGAEVVDVRRMVEQFQLAVRNLREIWSLVLPPVTLLELKKLAAQEPDHFQMQDALWARIVYDFALAHRLRNIRRAHLFGALTPLYLGWVASYTAEMNRRGPEVAADRLEQLARAFESEKPYLLSRWRWPDRFQP